MFLVPALCLFNLANRLAAFSSNCFCFSKNKRPTKRNEKSVQAYKK